MVISMNDEHYVYILKCSDESYYTGYTNCLERRLEEHQKGKAAKYTRGRLPVELAYHEKVQNKSVGLKREYEIKKLNRAKKMLLVKEGAKNVYTEEL